MAPPCMMVIFYAGEMTAVIKPNRLSVASAAAVTTALAAVSVAAAFVVASASTTACRLYFLGSSITNHSDCAFKTHLFSCKRMVEVHDHFLVSHFKHLAGDAVTVLSHHGNDSAYFHVLVVKLSVDFKNLFLMVS